MDIGKFVQEFLRELKPLIDWALSHWPTTLAAIGALIYLAGRQKRLHRRRS
jgi:hypothetical protein